MWPLLSGLIHNAAAGWCALMLLSFPVAAQEWAHTSGRTNADSASSAVSDSRASIRVGTVSVQAAASSASSRSRVLGGQSVKAEAATGVSFQNWLMTESVPNGAGCSPPAANTTFLTTDAAATVWFLVDGTSTGDQPKTEWYSPDGTLYTTYTWAPVSSPGSQCFWNSMYVAGKTPASVPGPWTVKVYWNGSLELTLPFTITTPSSSAAGSMPQLASAGGWDTSLTLLNLGGGPAQVSLNFFQNDGSPLALPFTFPQSPSAPGQQAGAFNQKVNGNALLMLDTTGPDSQTVGVGWAELLTAGNAGGFAIFKYTPTGQEAVVPLETRNASSYVLAFDNTGPTTGLAIANLAAQSANIPIVVRDDTGTVLGQVAILNLSAHGHTSFMLTDNYSVTAGKRGTVEFDTPPGGQISVLGLRVNGAALTTLPVLAAAEIPGGWMAHVASGGGWQTTFTLVNVGTTPAQTQLSFFDDSGNPLSMPLTLVQSGSTVTTSMLNETIAGGATLVVLAQGDETKNSVVGSAQLSSTGDVGGFAIFRYNPTGQEAVVPLEMRNANAYALAFDNTSGLKTGLALLNGSNQAENVPVFLRDDTGAYLGQATVNLPALGHTSFMLTDNYSVTAGRRGTVEFDTPANGQISALGLRATPSGVVTTIPVLVTTTTSGGTPPPGSFTLAAQTVGTGSGTVIANPPGPTYRAGATVTLTAVPSTGSIFGGWSGACSGTGPCVVNVVAAQSVTATFTIAAGQAEPLLASVNPSSGALGQVLTVVINAANTHFVQGQTLAMFGAGISVGGAAEGQAGPIIVTSPTSATAEVTVDPSASIGARTVAVTTGPETASLGGGFAIISPPAPLGPLAIVLTSPTNKINGVSLAPQIEIGFNEPLDPATVGPSTFTFANGSKALPVTVSYSATNKLVMLTPSGALSPQTTYTVTIAALVRSIAESPLGQPFTFSFTTLPAAAVNGVISVPSGLDATTLSVVSFSGNKTKPDSSGSFSASLNPLGTSLVAAMLPNKAFGLMAVAIGGMPTTSNSNVPSALGPAANAVFSPSSAAPVHTTRWQVTASAEAAGSPNGIVDNFQTTAEALVFMSPYLFTADPKRAPAILGAIAANPATAQFAQALNKSWTEADPLSDPVVQSAGKNAVQAVVQALISQNSPQQSASVQDSALHAQTSWQAQFVSSDATSSTAPASWSPATVAVTPYCWNGETPTPLSDPLPCLDLDYISFSGSVSVNQTSGSYGFSPENCTGKTLGCAVGWLGRITPLPPESGNLAGIIAGGPDSFGPESPAVPYEPSSCTTSVACYSTWLSSNSAFQYADLVHVFLAGLSTTLQQYAGLVPPMGPANFSLPAPLSQQTNYIARFYSGGLADSGETINISNGQYPDGSSMAAKAFVLNLIESTLNLIAMVPGPTSVADCAVQAAVPQLVEGSTVLGNSTTVQGILADYTNVTKDVLTDAVSCAEDQGVQSIFEMAIEALSWGTGLGTVLDISSSIANFGEAAQRTYELVYDASAVETAVIAIAPGSEIVSNPVPSITSLSPSLAVAGGPSQSVTINGTDFLSNSIVTFNGVPHEASLTASGQLTITLTSSDLDAPGTFPVIVANPQPGGGKSHAAIFTVQPPSTTPVLQNLTLSASSVVGGSSVTGTVSLSGVAPTGGIQVSLSSTSTSAQVPPSVTIAPGQNTATFTIITTAVTSTETSTITASLGPVQLSATVSVVPSKIVLGQIFAITGTMPLGGQTLSIEMHAIANGDGSYFVLFDDQASEFSGIDIVLGMNASLSASGNTVTLKSASVLESEYSDITNPSQPVIANITAATITITFTSLTVGSPITGTVSFAISGTGVTASNGTVQGKFTGTLTEMD